jgi:hypothetical protein
MKNTELLNLGVNVLLQYGPTAYAAFINLAHNEAPTKEDFLALGNAVSQESYDNFIAAAKARAGVAI